MHNLKSEPDLCFKGMKIVSSSVSKFSEKVDLNVFDICKHKSLTLEALFDFAVLTHLFANDSNM
ncbi:MAG: hypothetical protein Rpha_0176 [Candidatus Ruthia sp. Apha_13_S6]|nr:hypothetical protein [Candidatus Ruthia sp. Apha_13_S6]